MVVANVKVSTNVRFQQMLEPANESGGIYRAYFDLTLSTIVSQFMSQTVLQAVHCPCSSFGCHSS